MKENAEITYQLILQIEETITVKIGALGEFIFPAGKYLYTGSARKNLEQRLNRHLKKSKKLRWHIDYLTVQPQVKIIGVKTFKEEECAINQTSPGKILVPGFGSSDCRKHCGAHLKFLGNTVGEK